jgi:outer membrane protein assembly factor BamB
MLRRMAAVWLIASTVLAGGSAWGQRPFPRDLVPRRTALERLGLERQWYGVVPLVEAERLLRISLAEGMVFAQTSYAMLYAFDGESGRLLWSAQLGERTGFARGVAANSYAVFVTNANNFFALDRGTGRLIWRYDLGTIPTSPPACDEDLAVVGLTSGKVHGIQLKQKDDQGKDHIRTIPWLLWTYTTGGPVQTRPLIADQVVAIGSSDSKVWVVFAYEVTSLFRFNTGAPIGEGMVGYGTRMLLIPSADNNLYAVDLFSARAMWTFASGSPIAQEPQVGDEDIFTLNTAGFLTSLDPSTGEPRWSTATHGGRLAAISPTKVYLRSDNRDLFIVERKSGRTLVNPGESHLRIGLNLREYNLDIVNRFNDRMYFGTDSGMIVCLREAGLARPQPLKDPKAPHFGYVPPEGIKETPPPPAAGEQPKAEEAAPGEEPAKAKEKEQPDEEKAKEKPAEKDKDDAAEEKEKPAAKDSDAPAKKDDDGGGRR